MSMNYRLNTITSSTAWLRHREPSAYLAYLMQQVEAQQNREAAKEIVITGWHLGKEGHTEQDRDRILHWAVPQANTDKEVLMMSHRTREDMLSYMSIITIQMNGGAKRSQPNPQPTTGTRTARHGTSTR
jgi:hypothetical protein